MKNTTAKFSTKTKEAIYERDGGVCVLCESNQGLVAHHVYFSDQAIRDKTRNNVDQGVTICPTCHNGKDKDGEQGCHGCSAGEGKRQEAIDYLNNLYGI